MKPPGLTFESPSALFGKRASAAGWVGAALAIAALAWLAVAAWQLVRTDQQRVALQARLDATHAASAPTPPPRTAAQIALHDQRLRAWNAMARQLNTPWTDLLDTLEARTPNDVALVSIEPDAAQATVRLQAEARTLQSLLAYEQALRTAPLFREVALARHETNDSDPMRPVRVHLLLRMQAAASGAAK